MCIGRSGRVEVLTTEGERRAGGEEALYTDLKRRFVPQIHAQFEQQHTLMVWRFPLELSQSRIAGRKTRSSACTIITIKLAELIYRQGIRTIPKANGISNASSSIERNMALPSPPTTMCPPELTNAFINAIIEGNELHNESCKQKKAGEISNELYRNRTFTIPQALQVCGNVFEEVQYVSVQGRIIDNIEDFIVGPIRCRALAEHAQIFMLLIACERAMLLLFDRQADTIALMDSHAHLYSDVPRNAAGAVISVCQLDDISSFVQWMCRRILPDTLSYENDNQSFEMSVIVFAGSLEVEDKPVFQAHPVHGHVFPLRRLEQMPFSRPTQTPLFKSICSTINIHNLKYRRR